MQKAKPGRKEPAKRIIPDTKKKKPHLVLMKGTSIVAEDGTVNEQAVKEFAAACGVKRPGSIALAARATTSDRRSLSRY